MPMCNFCFIHLVCYQIIDVEYTYAFGISYAVLLYICNVMYVVSVLSQSCTQHSSEDLETYMMLLFSRVMTVTLTLLPISHAQAIQDW